MPPRGWRARFSLRHSRAASVVVDFAPLCETIVRDTADAVAGEMLLLDSCTGLLPSLTRTTGA